MTRIMRQGLALLSLIWHFLRDMVLGGLTTLGIILSPRAPQPGWLRLAYGNLPEGYAALLGALICLTPGSTTVHIDTRRREILLHVLDVTQADVTLTALERDFILPLAVLAGVRS